MVIGNRSLVIVKNIYFPQLPITFYLFTNNVPTDETAAALLQFGELYLKSKTGNIPWQQFPQVLQEVSIAKIPTMSR